VGLGGGVSSSEEYRGSGEAGPAAREGGGEGHALGGGGGNVTLWVAADYRAVYAAVREAAAELGGRRGVRVHVAHLGGHRAQGLQARLELLVYAALSYWCMRH
jgi:hypothetical protein